MCVSIQLLLNLNGRGRSSKGLGTLMRNSSKITGTSLMRLKGWESILIGRFMILSLSHIVWKNRVFRLRGMSRNHSSSHFRELRRAILMRHGSRIAVTHVLNISYNTSSFLFIEYSCWILIPCWARIFYFVFSLSRRRAFTFPYYFFV